MPAPAPAPAPSYQPSYQPQPAPQPPQGFYPARSPLRHLTQRH